MGLGVKCPKRRAGPRRIGLILSTIRYASLLKIMVESDGSLAIDDPIMGETEKRGLVVVHR